MNRILVVMSAYNEEEFIMRNIRNLYPYVDKIAVSTTNHITGSESTDDTWKKLHIFTEDEDEKNKIVVRDTDLYNNKLPFDIREGMVKTELMNMMEPEDGNWIWIVDADEHYSSRQLELLRSRYVLNHNALQYNKHCIMVTAMVFAYNLNHFYFSRHGRFFRYKKGSYFSSVNHFTWADGEPVYGDKYGWDVSPAYFYMYHLRYVRSSIDRLRDRYIYRQDKAGLRKLKWFDNVFMDYPVDRVRALNYNKQFLGSDGFDSMLGGDLKYIKDPDIPKELENLNIDLWKEIKYGKNDLLKPFEHGDKL